MYKELTIENIKTFEKEQKLKLRPITLLYGENSSGKTTLLKTFDIVHNIFAEYQVKRGKNISEKEDIPFYRNENIQNISAKKIHYFSSQINKKPLKIQINLNLPYNIALKDIPSEFTDVEEKEIYKDMLFSNEAEKEKSYLVPIKIKLTIKYYPKKKISKVQYIEIRRSDNKMLVAFSRIDKNYKRIENKEEVGYMTPGYHRTLTRPDRYNPLYHRGRPMAEPDYFVDETLYSDYKIIAPKDNSLWDKDFDAYRKIFTDSTEIKHRFNKIYLLFHYLNLFRYELPRIDKSVRRSIDSKYRVLSSIDKTLARIPFGHKSPIKTMFSLPEMTKTSYKFIAYLLTKNILETKIKDMDKIEGKIQEFIRKTGNAKWCDKIKKLYENNEKKFKSNTSVRIRNNKKYIPKKQAWNFNATHLFASKIANSKGVNTILLKSLLRPGGIRSKSSFCKLARDDLENLFHIRFHKKYSFLSSTLVRDGIESSSTFTTLRRISDYIYGDLPNVMIEIRDIFDINFPVFKTDERSLLLTRCKGEISQTVRNLVICHPHKTNVPFFVPSEADFPLGFLENLKKIKSENIRKELAQQDARVFREFAGSAGTALLTNPLNPFSAYKTAKSWANYRKSLKSKYGKKSSKMGRPVREIQAHEIRADGANFDRAIVRNKKIRKELNKILKEILNLEIIVVTPKFLKKILKDEKQYQAFRDAQRRGMMYPTGMGMYSKNAFVMLRDLNFKKPFQIHGDEVGKGPSNILPFLTQLLSDKPNLTYLVQELENNWHPKYQAKIINLIARIMKMSKNKNFILETHSELFVLQVKKLVQQGILKPEDVSINYISRTNQGNSKIHHIPVNLQGGFEKPWPGGFFTERMEVITS